MQVVDNGSGWKHSSPPALLHVPWSAGPALRDAFGGRPLVVE